jgi:hypothetical protein
MTIHWKALEEGALSYGTISLLIHACSGKKCIFWIFLKKSQSFKKVKRGQMKFSLQQSFFDHLWGLTLPRSFSVSVVDDMYTVEDLYKILYIVWTKKNSVNWVPSVKDIAKVFVNYGMSYIYIVLLCSLYTWTSYPFQPIIYNCLSSLNMT